MKSMIRFVMINIKRESFDFKVYTTELMEKVEKGLAAKDVEFYSLCEHHLLPFFGHVHVAYIPDQKIIGLSKVGRIIDVFAKRLQVQENLTHEIAESIDKLLKPKGIAVSIEAQHFCMMMRGIKKQGSVTQTNEYRGIFLEDINMRLEFLQAIKK